MAENVRQQSRDEWVENRANEIKSKIKGGMIAGKEIAKFNEYLLAAYDLGYDIGFNKGYDMADEHHSSIQIKHPSWRLMLIVFLCFTIIYFIF